MITGKITWETTNDDPDDVDVRVTVVSIQYASTEKTINGNNKDVYFDVSVVCNDEETGQARIYTNCLAGESVMKCIESLITTAVAAQANTKYGVGKYDIPRSKN